MCRDQCSPPPNGHVPDQWPSPPPSLLSPPSSPPPSGSSRHPGPPPPAENLVQPPRSPATLLHAVPHRVAAKAHACALTRVRQLAPPPQHQALQCSSCCSCSLQEQPTRGGGRRRCALKRIERCFATCRAKYIKRALFQTFTYCPPPAPRCFAARALCSAAVTSPHARRRNRTSTV